MLVFFVGGPWNNRLQEMGECPARGYYRASEPMAAINSICEQHAPGVTSTWEADYYPDGTLLTGVPVYSCLWGRPRNQVGWPRVWGLDPKAVP